MPSAFVLSPALTNVKSHEKVSPCVERFLGCLSSKIRGAEAHCPRKIALQNFLSSPWPLIIGPILVCVMGLAGLSHHQHDSQRLINAFVLGSGRDFSATKAPCICTKLFMV